jgi:hypothetical protein
MAARFLPNKPPIEGPLDTWVMKEWLQDMQRALVANTTVAPVQAANFVPEIGYWFYPCNTAAGAIVVTLPPAADIIGKQYVFQQTSALNTTTINPSGADTVNGGAGVVLVAINTAAWLVSDGVSNWYKINPI